MPVDFAFLEYYEGPVPLSQAFVTCNMIATKKPLIPSRATIAIQKNFPFKRIFNYYLDLIKEKGHFNRISSYYEMPQQGWLGDAGHFRSYHYNTSRQMWHREGPAHRSEQCHCSPSHLHWGPLSGWIAFPAGIVGRNLLEKRHWCICARTKEISIDPK